MRISLLAATAAAFLLAAGSAHATPVTVNVRIEGASSTIFEGPVTTDAKTLTKDSTGPHPCDGTNGGANTTPGPTMTTALDDASIAGGFTWDGTWFSFGDFGIDRIGPDAQDVADNKFWGYALNYQPSQVGGCQQEVANGDQVLFAYDFFSKSHLLKLTGPASAAPGQPFTVHVVDGQDNSAISGASVGGATTDASGDATVTLTTLGDNTLKASRDDSVRSNALHVCVHAGNDGNCGTTTPPPAGPAAAPDRTPPLASVSSIREHEVFAHGHGPRTLTGTVGSDQSGLKLVKLRLTRRAGGHCYVFSNHRARFARVRCGADRPKFFAIGSQASWSYLLPARLGPGRYVLDVTAVDGVGNRDTTREVGRNRLIFTVR